MFIGCYLKWYIRYYYYECVINWKFIDIFLGYKNLYWVIFLVWIVVFFIVVFWLRFFVILKFYWMDR